MWKLSCLQKDKERYERTDRHIEKRKEIDKQTDRQKERTVKECHSTQNEKSFQRVSQIKNGIINETNKKKF